MEYIEVGKKFEIDINSDIYIGKIDFEYPTFNDWNFCINEEYFVNFKKKKYFFKIPIYVTIYKIFLKDVRVIETNYKKFVGIDYLRKTIIEYIALDEAIKEAKIEHSKYFKL